MNSLNVSLERSLNDIAVAFEVGARGGERALRGPRRLAVGADELLVTGDGAGIPANGSAGVVAAAAIAGVVAVVAVVAVGICAFVSDARGDGDRRERDVGVGGLGLLRPKSGGG